jgi:hypothetical protein
MTFRTLWKREFFVIAHGQSPRFRIVKYIVLLAIGIVMYTWQGWNGVLTLFLSLFLLGIIVHFLFRWKTKGWTQSWDPYKKMDRLP